MSTQQSQAPAPSTQPVDDIARRDDIAPEQTPGAAAPSKPAPAANDPVAAPVPLATPAAGRTAGHSKRAPTILSNGWRIDAARDLEPELDGNFLIENMIPRGLTQIFGEPNCGKTALALSFALCIATGRSVCGQDVEQSPVLYVAAENPRSVRNRVIATAKRLGIAREATDLLHILDAPLNMLSDEDVSHLEHIIDPRLRDCALILDTQAMVTPGADENSNSEMSRLVAAAGRLRRNVGASVILIHHTAKNTDISRGAGSVYGGLDAALLVKSGMFHVQKARDFDKKGLSYTFEIVGEPIGVDRKCKQVTAGVALLGERVAVSAQPVSNRRRATATKKELALAALERLAAQNADGVTLEAWRAACTTEFGAVKPDSFARMFRMAKKVLEESGAIEIVDGTVIPRADAHFSFDSLNLAGVKPATLAI